MSAVVVRSIATTVGPLPLPPQNLLGKLGRLMRVTIAEVQSVHKRNQQLAKDFAATDGDEAARRRVVLEHLVETVPDPKRRRGDMKSLDRWLDLEALSERELMRINRLLERQATLLDMVAHMAPIPELQLPPNLADRLWKLAGTGQRELVREHALIAIRCWLETGRASVQRLRDRGRLRELERICMDGEQHPFTQIEGLRTMAAADGMLGSDVCRKRVEQPMDLPDDFIVRGYALGIWGRIPDPRPTTDELAEARYDNSEHVRQHMMRALARYPAGEGYPVVVRLMGEEQSGRVVAEGLHALAGHAEDDEKARDWLETALVDTLRRDTATEALRAALDVTLKWVEASRPLGDRITLLRVVSERARREKDLTMAEYAASVARALMLSMEPDQLKASLELRKKLADVREGGRVTIEHDSVSEPALRHAARGDMALSARRKRGGLRITKGERRRPRMWRFLFELRTPVPDKRKGYSHVRARATGDELLVPPVGCAEVTPTRVPGERRLVNRLGTWGPFLPRVDDVLASLERGKPIRLLTSVGTVEVRPPRRLAKRLLTRLKLTTRYQQYADMRDASLAAAEAGDQCAYVKALREEGFEVELDPEPADVDGESVAVELPYVGPFLSSNSFVLPAFLEGPLDYFLSESGNRPVHLGLAVFLLFSYLLMRGALLYNELRVARASFPLSVGGWGTRGKSGTERLKAGLFQGMGYDVFVKTTGCEAMFIHAIPGKVANEVFLYRPYDKATIWEQFNVLRLGAGMRAHVFLWECMALNPHYVQLLSHHWMQDDLTTLTNAYPDHEDVQGPSGEDVARTISGFIPPKGRALTTEDQMLPLLREQAALQGAEFTWVDYWASDRISQDLMERYPYQEHPRNIALVARLLEEFDVDPVRSIVEMADHVVADLGVLKTYPEVGYKRRRMDFSNAMSANERAGFLASWERLGMTAHDPRETPESIPMVVINNRADRVPRSRVFARILVRDVSVGGMVVIGTNLSGMSQFLKEEIDDWLSAESVAREDEAPESRIERFDEFLLRLKIRPGAAALRDRLALLLSSIGFDRPRADEWMRSVGLAGGEPDAARVEELVRALLEEQKVEGELAEDILRFAAQAGQRYTLLKETHEALLQDDMDSANARFREIYGQLFSENLVMLWDPALKGNQVVDRITASIPPGHTARLVGVQNIKGTGLDFVYRWLSIEKVRAYCNDLKDKPRARSAALESLGGHGDWGLIDTMEAAATIESVLEDLDDAQREVAEPLMARLNQQAAAMEKKLHASTKTSAFKQVLGVVEKWVDYLDSIHRRVKADRIVEDLAAERVGHGRAAQIMRELTARGKGGWLPKAFEKSGDD